MEKVLKFNHENGRFLEDGGTKESSWFVSI